MMMGSSAPVADRPSSRRVAPDVSHLGIRVLPESALIGARVLDVKLGPGLEDAKFEAIKQLLYHYHVLFFEDQEMTPEEHRDFAKRFGELQLHPLYPTVPGIPEIVVLDAHVTPPDNDCWHTDVTFVREPPLGSILYARKIPAVGGDTIWSDSAAAFEGLSPKMQQYLDGLYASHDFERSFPKHTAQDPEKWKRTRETHEPVIHPMVRRHPVTGQKGLFVNRGFTTHICDVPRAESEAILHFLEDHIQKPEYTVRHKWKVNDIAFWDNRITQHYALNDYLPQGRIMHRALLKGDVPV